MDEFVVEKNEQNQKKKLGNSKSQKRQKKKKVSSKATKHYSRWNDDILNLYLTILQI